LDLGLVYIDEKLRNRPKTLMIESKIQNSRSQVQMVATKEKSEVSSSPDNIQCSAHISSSRNSNELILVLFER
jgi:hypothetical protein